VAQFVARVYPSGKQLSVVVEGLGSAEVDRLDQAAARSLRLGRLRAPYPTRAKPWEDPTAKAIYEFEVAVVVSEPLAPTTK